MIAIENKKYISLCLFIYIYIVLPLNRLHADGAESLQPMTQGDHSSKRDGAIFESCMSWLYLYYEQNVSTEIKLSIKTNKVK
jgi:hypothetical protein